MGKTSKKKTKPFILCEKISKKVENALKNDVIKFRPSGAYCTLCKCNIKFDKSSDAAQEIHIHLTNQKHNKRSNEESQESTKKANVRCGNCEGCLKPNCNKCKYCVNNNNNEEGNELKKRCVTQKCLGMIKKVSLENKCASLKLTKKPKQQGSSLGFHRSNDGVRWILSAITSAVSEHRWEDAATLLPAMILRHEGHITDDFMWRVIDTVSSNAPSISDGTKSKLRRLMVKMRRSNGEDSKHVRCGSMDMHEKVVLDSLAQELTKSSNFDDLKDEVQKLENILEMRGNKGQRLDPAQTNVSALVVAYRGVFLYSKWKFLKMSVVNKEANQERKLQDDTVSSSEEMNISMWQSAHSVFGGLMQNQQESIDSKVVGTEALHVLKTALEKLTEPCEFALGPYLELQFELNGPQGTLEVIEEYRRKYPDHLPGKKLLYFVTVEKLCSEKTLQMEMLKEICDMCDQDPLVLHYVDQLLQIASSNESLSHYRQAGQHDNPDSGLEDFSDNSADESEEEEVEHKMSQTYTSVGINNTEYVCSLQPDGYVGCLLLCVSLLCRFLEYPQFRNHLPAWQKLTLVLKRLHHAWLRCWYCSKCEQSKKKIRVIRRKINCLWKFIIWKQPTNDMSQEEAQILMNKAYAAHFFCFSEDYILQATAALVKSGCSYLAKELLGYINFSAPHTEKFTNYRNKRRTSYALHRRPTFGMNEIQQMFGVTKVSNVQKKDESTTPSINTNKSQGKRNSQPIIAVDGSCDITEGESVQSDRVEGENCSMDRIEVECDGYIEMSQTNDGSSSNNPFLSCNIIDKENEVKDETKCEDYQTVDKRKKSHNMHIFSQFTNEKEQNSLNSLDNNLKERKDKEEAVKRNSDEIKNFAMEVKATLQKLGITLAEVIENGQNNVELSRIQTKSDLIKFFKNSHPPHIMEKIKEYLGDIIAERKSWVKNGSSRRIKSQDKLDATTINSSFNDSDLDDLPMPSQLYTESNVNSLPKIQSTADVTECKTFFSESILFDENLFVTSTQIPQNNNNSNLQNAEKLIKGLNNNSNTFQANCRESLEKSYDKSKQSVNQYVENIKVQRYDNYDDKADESDGEYDDDSDTDMEETNMEFKPIGTIYPASLTTKLGGKISNNEIISKADENKGNEFNISRKEHCEENKENNTTQDRCRVGPHASSGKVYLKHDQKLVLAGAVDVHHHEINYDSDTTQCSNLPVNSQISRTAKDYNQSKSQLLERKSVNDNIADNKNLNLSLELGRNSVRSQSGSDLDMTVEEEQFDPYNMNTPLQSVTYALKSGFDAHSNIIQLPKSMYNDKSEMNGKSNNQNKLSLSNRRKTFVIPKVEENLENEALSNTQSSTITCGQRDQKSVPTDKPSSSSRNSSSGYKAGSSGEHDISIPDSQDLNDSSVFFQYTELPVNLPTTPHLDLKEIPNDLECAENEPLITSIPETQELSQDIDNIQENNMKSMGDTKPKFNLYAELSFIPGNEELDVLDNTLNTSIPITCGQRESFDTTPDEINNKDLSLILNNSVDNNTLSNDEEFYSSKSAAASSDCLVISDSCSDSDNSDSLLAQNHCYSALKGLKPNESGIENDNCLNVSSHEIEIVTKNDNSKNIKSNNRSKSRKKHTKVIGESNDPAVFDHSPVKPTKPFKVIKVQYPEELEESSTKNISDDETENENTSKILENMKTLCDGRYIQPNETTDSNSDVFYTATEDEENLNPDSQKSNKENKNERLDKGKENSTSENTENRINHIKQNNYDKTEENCDMNEHKISKSNEKKEVNLKVNPSSSNEQSTILKTQKIDLDYKKSKKSRESKKDVLSVEEEAYKNRSINEGHCSSRIPATGTVESKVKTKKSSKENQDVLSLEEEHYKNSSMSIQELDCKIKKKKKKKNKDQSPIKQEISKEKILVKNKEIQISSIGCSLQIEEKLYKNDIVKDIPVSNKKNKKRKSNKQEDLIIGEKSENKCISSSNLNYTSDSKRMVCSLTNAAIQKESETLKSIAREDGDVNPKKKKKKKKKKDSMKDKAEIYKENECVQGKNGSLNRNENYDTKKEKKKKKNQWFSELEEIDDSGTNYSFEENDKESKKKDINLNRDEFEFGMQQKINKEIDKEILILSDIEVSNKNYNEVDVKKRKKSKKKKSKHERHSLVNNRDEIILSDTKCQSPVSGIKRKGNLCKSNSSCGNYETCEEEQDLVEYINKTNNVEKDKCLGKMKSFIEKVNDFPDDVSNNDKMQGKIAGKTATCRNEIKSTFTEDKTKNEIDDVQKRFNALKQKRKEKRDPSHSVDQSISFSETPEGIEIKAEVNGIVGEVNDWLSDKLFNIESKKIIGSGLDANENMNKSIEFDYDSLVNDTYDTDIKETDVSKDDLLNGGSDAESFETKIKKNKELKNLKQNKKKKANKILKNQINSHIPNSLYTSNEGEGNAEDNLRSSDKIKKKCQVSSEIKDQSISKEVESTDDSSTSKKKKKRKNIILEMKDNQEETEVDSLLKKLKKGKQMGVSVKDDNQEITDESKSRKEKKRKNSVVQENEGTPDKTKVESSSEVSKRKNISGNEDKQIEIPEESTTKEIKMSKHIDMLENDNKIVDAIDKSSSKKGKKRKHIDLPENEERLVETADKSTSKKRKKGKHIDMPEMEKKHKEITSEPISKKIKRETNASMEHFAESEKGNANTDESMEKRKKKQYVSMVQIPKTIISEYISPVKTSNEIRKLKKSKKSKKHRESAMSNISSDVDHLFSMPIASLKNIVDQEKKNKLKLDNISRKEVIATQNGEGHKGHQKSRVSGSSICKTNSSFFSEDLDDLPFFSDEEIVQLFNSKDIVKKEDKDIGIEEKIKSKKQISTKKETDLNVDRCFENEKAYRENSLSQRDKKKKKKVKEKESHKKIRKSSIEDEIKSELINTSIDTDQFFNDSDLDDLPFPDLEEKPEKKQSSQKIHKYEKKEKQKILDSSESRNSKEKDFVTPITEIKSNMKNNKSKVARLRQDSFKEDLSPILPPSTIRKHKLFSPEKAEVFSATPPNVPLSQ